MFSKSQESPIWIIFIILTGLAMRVLWLMYADPVPVSDFEGYRRLGEYFLKQGQIGIPDPSAYRLPVYPVFLAIIMTISKSVAWLSFVNIILSTFLIYVVYVLTLQLTSNKLPAVIAALICAFYPTFIFFSPVLASEHLYIALLLSAFGVLGYNWSNISIHKAWKPILAGILFGLAVLTRGEGIFFLPILLTWSYLTSTKKGLNKILVALISLLTFVITISPWYIRNNNLIGPGSGLSTTGGVNFYYAHNEKSYGYHSLNGTIFEDKSELQRQKLGYKLGFEYLSKASISKIAKDIARGTKGLFFSPSYYSVEWSTKLPSTEPGKSYTSKELNGIYWFKISILSYYFLLLTSCLSSLFFRRYNYKPWIFLYGIVFMNWIGYAWIFWGKPRYRFSSEVIFCILSSIFLFELIKYFRKSN